MILVTGATGTVGRHAVALLAAEGLPVRAFVRDRAKALAMGWGPEVEVFEGDLGVPAAVEGAMAGVRKVLLVSGNGPGMAAAQTAVVEAARRGGTVEHVVKVSGGPYVAPDSPIAVGRAHRRVERALEESGIPYTLLRPSFFMQNLLGTPAAQVREKGRIVLPLGNARLSMVDARDVAAVAAAALAEGPEGGHAGKAYDVTGPAAVSGADVARALSAQLGRRVRYRSVPLWLFRRVAPRQGVDRRQVEHTAELFRHAYLPGLGARISAVVGDATGREPTGLARFVEEHRAAFAAVPDVPLPPIRVKRVQHVAVFVSDVARSRRFYEQTLGLRYSDVDTPGMAPAMRVTDQTLSFMSAGELHHDLVLVHQGDHRGNTRPVTPDDFATLAWKLRPEKDLREFADRLRTLGVPVEAGAATPPLGQEKRPAVRFRDPDGHAVEVHG